MSEQPERKIVCPDLESVEKEVPMPDVVEIVQAYHPLAKKRKVGIYKFVEEIEVDVNNE